MAARSDTPLAHSPTLPQPVPSDAGELGGKLAPGTPVGEYVIDHFLGAGAMGEVYAGHHPVIGKKVAIKILRHELATSEEAAERFTREARAVNQVDHPNVIDTFAYGRLGDGRLYLVMALVAGESLRARLRDGALDLTDALTILEQICEALDAAHERGVVHRDLKPDTIMIAPPQRVFVLDFGIAKLICGEAKPGNGTLTGQGTWLGTPAYMAPEQWSTDGAGPASDRYALGVISFELLSGHLPFSASSVPGMMEQHFRAKVPALSMRGSTSSALDDVLVRALAKDPDARYPSAMAFVAALRGAAGTAVGKGAAKGAVETRATVAPRRWLYGALGAGTLGLGIVGAVMVHGDHPAPALALETPPEPVAGSIAVEVTSTPDHAVVAIGDHVVGTTPHTLHVAKNAQLELTVKKPGYLPSHRAFSSGSSDSQLAINLGAVSRFEGVWKLPTGELRAFERDGERVAISKLTEVDGHRTLFKSYPFVEAETGIAFATDDEVIDPRAPDEKSCHIQVHVEYRYDAATDQLVLRRPTVAIDFVGGQCVARRQELVPQGLVRVDAAHDSVEISAPAGTFGKSLSKSPSKQLAKQLTKKPQKSIVPFDVGSKGGLPTNSAENKIDLPEQQYPRQAPLTPSQSDTQGLNGSSPQAAQKRQ